MHTLASELFQTTNGRRRGVTATGCALLFALAAATSALAEDEGKGLAEAAAGLPDWVLVVILFLAALVILGTAWRASSSWMHQAILAATAPLMPTVALVAALVSYLTWSATWRAPVAGFVVALLVWCGIALLWHDFPTAERCNQSSYGELKQRLTQLRARLAEASQTKSATVAFQQAQAQHTELDSGLSDQKTGLPWVMATGYINLWERLHRAEEAMIELLPKQTAIAQALKDELRLMDSKIENSTDLLAKLRHAVVTLDPDARSFLKLSADENKLIESLVPTMQAKPEAERDAIARPILRMIRRNINEYRDGLYDVFVTTRNRTWGTTIFTGLTAFLLLAIAMITKVERSAIVAGVTFYLVGAAVGLWSRLRNESEEAKDVPDYGLSTARLYSTPLYCGLAAVGGVVLTAVLPFAGNVFTPKVATNTAMPTPTSVTTPAAHKPENGPRSAVATPTPMTTPPENKSDKGKSTAAKTEEDDANTAPKKPTLRGIFDLTTNLVGILVAAVFGLTPSLLFNRLQQQSERYKSDLKSSEPTQGQGKK